MMNCGYDPAPGGKYDLPPIAPQMWHAYHVAGEQMSMAILAALMYRHRTGKGQHVSCAVHEAVSKCTEVDLMTWVMRRAPIFRQTCRHARESVSPHPTIAHTKDGRWVMANLGNRPDDGEKLIALMEKYGIEPGLDKETAKTPRVRPLRAGHRARQGEPRPSDGGRDALRARVHLREHPLARGTAVGNAVGAVAQAARERARPPLDQAGQRHRCRASRAWQVVPLCDVEVDRHGHRLDAGAVRATPQRGRRHGRSPDTARRASDRPEGHGGEGR